MSFGKVILSVIIFAVAFAYVEASVVVYLRQLLGIGFTPPSIGKDEVLFLTPHIAFLELETAAKIIADTGILNLERIREIATLVMLAAVAFLAGKKILEIIAYFFLGFGVWDIFYYVFLKLTIGWPKDFRDLDTFFLLPTPLVGSVFIPVIISLSLILGSLIYLLHLRRS